MKIFRNRFYTARDYECTNIVACEAAELPASPDGRWVPATRYVLQGLDHIRTEAGVKFYGYL